MRNFGLVRLIQVSPVSVKGFVLTPPTCRRRTLRDASMYGTLGTRNLELSLSHSIFFLAVLANDDMAQFPVLCP